MKLSLTSLLFLFLFSAHAAHAAGPFKSMVCKKTISDEIYISVEKSQMAVKWSTRGGDDDLVKLLKALDKNNIPLSLLGAYGDIHVEFSLPLEACEFSDPGKFSCDYTKGKKGKSLPISIAAKVSPYDLKVKPDWYHGTLSAVALGSQFYGKKNERYLKFPMRFSVETPNEQKISAESDFFFAHAWDYDGFPQNPSCTVDKAFLVD